MSEQIAVCDTSLDEKTYAPDAILFDGITDFMLRGADLTGIIDGKEVAISFWFRVDVWDGTSRYIFTNEIIRFANRLESPTNRLNFVGRDSASTLIANINSIGENLAGSGYHHAMMSWNTATDEGSAFIDDVDRTARGPFTDLPVDFTDIEWLVGARTAAGANKFIGAISDLWMTTEFIDLSVEANRRKFIDADGNPVFLGNTGQFPTGTAALVYLRGNQTDQGINSGTGGDFVSQGVQTPGETPGPVAVAPGTFPRSWNGL